MDKNISPDNNPATSGQTGTPTGAAVPPTSMEDAMELATKIQPAMNKLVVIFQRTTEGSSLTSSQVSIMNRLKEEGACRISHVASMELIRMPTASNALLQLEKRDLVSRVRDEDDRRGVKVALTDKGRQILDEVSEQRSEALARIIQWLGPEHINTAENLAELINELSRIYRPSQP